VAAAVTRQNGQVRLARAIGPDARLVRRAAEVIARLNERRRERHGADQGLSVHAAPDAGQIVGCVLGSAHGNVSSVLPPQRPQAKCSGELNFELTCGEILLLQRPLGHKVIQRASRAPVLGVFAVAIMVDLQK
jgi:hypothetical protein